MAPFLICDPTNEGVTEYAIDLDGQEVISPAFHVPEGVQIHFDLASVPPGNHTVTAKARKVVPMWGVLESVASAPFSFERPAQPEAPANIKLGQA